MRFMINLDVIPLWTISATPVASICFCYLLAVIRHQLIVHIILTLLVTSLVFQFFFGTLPPIPVGGGHKTYLQ